MQTRSGLESDWGSCNLCGVDQYTVVAQTKRCVQTREEPYAFHVRLVCSNWCGLVYWNPRKTAAELWRYYAAVYRAPLLDNIDEDRRNMIQSRVQSLKQCVRGGRLLEIGSAEGFFLQKAIDEVLKQLALTRHLLRLKSVAG